MKICLETSSLLPLLVSTPYTERLIKRITNEKNEYFIFKDCLREAMNAKFLQIDSYNCILENQTHNNFALSIIRNINEHFTSQNLHHNYARGCTIFIIDILDQPYVSLNYEDYCKEVHDKIKEKIDRIKLRLSNNKISLTNNSIEYYWWISPDFKNSPFSLSICVINDEESTNSINKERDVYHFKQFLEDGSFDELWVCDSGFKNQIKDLKNIKYDKEVLGQIKHFNK